MMVSPELMSASSAPSARPLNSCETKFDQVTVLFIVGIQTRGDASHPPLQGKGRSSERSEDERGGVAEPPPPHPGSLSRADPPPAEEGEAAGSASQAQCSRCRRVPRFVLSIASQVAAERVGLLHQRLARHHLGDLPVVLLVLHVFRRLAFDD